MRQYHEVYGFMPKDVINRLSQFDRNKMFINWLLREPTPTGWFFTKTIVAALGEDFINYLFEKVDDGMNSDGTEVTKESLLEAVKELMNSFASDINILYEYVELYYEEYPEKLLIIVDNLIEDVNKLLSTAENGKMIKEGINTVIVGKPNAGKSSLLNLLVGEEKAIVTEIAGTTRDILEEDIRISGISLHIIDTAGIRRAEDIVEKIGVEKAKQQVMEADLIIYVVDSSVPLDENDFDIIEMIQDKKCIILFNKTDLESLVSVENLKKRTGKDTVIIKTSTKENTGINDFENAVKEMFFHGEISLNDEVMITNMRHKEALQETLESLKQVKKSIKMQMPEDFYSIDLMSAYSSLGKIIGEEVEEDLVNEIFSKFCMGK